MDQVGRAFFEVTFERLFFHHRRGDAFQSFFSDIMEKCYPGDFQRVRPWGNLGDQKNDGYLRSRRMLFQVYAPDDMQATKTVRKINDDFLGALPHWRDYFDAWTFVHNAPNGLNPPVLRKLLDLEREYTDISFTNWGHAEIRKEVFSLGEEDLVLLLGHPPSQRDVVDLRLADLKDVILGIEEKPPSSIIDLAPVPAGKIVYNSLSQNVQVLLQTGMTKSDLVGKFFGTWTPDPLLGDRIAEGLTERYVAYRALGVEPDRIFGRLQEIVGQAAPNTPGGQVAVLAVLAYFFEQCDIFERPQDQVV